MAKDNSVTDGIIDPRRSFYPNIYRCDRAADSPWWWCLYFSSSYFLKSSAIDIDHTMFPNVEIVACWKGI